MSPMVCIECGRTYQNGEKFCARDDTPLVEVVLCDVCGATKRPGERTCTRCAEIELGKLARQRKATLLKIIGAVAAVTLLIGGFVGYRMTRPHRSDATRASNAVARSDDSARQVDVETGLPPGEGPEASVEPAEAPAPAAEDPPAEVPATEDPVAEVPAREDPADQIVVPGREGQAEQKPASAPEASPARPFFPLYVGERPGPSEEELSNRERFEAQPEPRPRARRAVTRKASIKARASASETRRKPVRTASAGWMRDGALESELAGRGVFGVKVLRKDRALRLSGTVNDDMQLRSLYEYVNQKGFGEVQYGVEVR